MKKTIFFIFVAITLLFAACDDIYDNAKEFASEETIYPAKYDFANAIASYNRVEIDLLEAGRIPASQIKLSKAKKTRVKYDNEVITIDSVASWVNITGLTEARAYTFKIYTVDDLGNESLPVEATLAPFTSVDLAALGTNTPRVTVAPATILLDWPNSTSNSSMDCDSLTYEYKDKNGLNKTTTASGNSAIATNLPMGADIEIKVIYHVWPKINGKRILDQVDVERTVVTKTQSGSIPFSPTEISLLHANGITTFTGDAVANVEKLSFSPALNTLSDIVYFPSLKILDLTGNNMMEGDNINHRIETYTYAGSNSIPAGEKRTTGGCKFIPILKRYQSLANDAQFLATLLNRGEIEKIYYYPGTLGLDAILQPYIATGQVEFVPCPDEVLFPNEFNVSVHVQQIGTCETAVTYPAADAPTGVGLQEIYKVHFMGPRSTLLFAFPSQYEINLQEYKYLKFKVYPPAKSKISPWGAKFQRVWPRFMNAIWGNDYSPAGGGGSGYWDFVRSFEDSELETWVDVTVDLSAAGAYHNRAFWIGFQIEEGSDSDSQKPAIQAADINYYISNIRLTK